METKIWLAVLGGASLVIVLLGAFRYTPLLLGESLQCSVCGERKKQLIGSSLALVMVFSLRWLMSEAGVVSPGLLTGMVPSSGGLRGLTYGLLISLGILAPSMAISRLYYEEGPVWVLWLQYTLLLALIGAYLGIRG